MIGNSTCSNAPSLIGSNRAHWPPCTLSAIRVSGDRSMDGGLETTWVLPSLPDRQSRTSGYNSSVGANARSQSYSGRQGRQARHPCDSHSTRPAQKSIIRKRLGVISCQSPSLWCTRYIQSSQRQDRIWNSRLGGSPNESFPDRQSHRSDHKTLTEIQSSWGISWGHARPPIAWRIRRSWNLVQQQDRGDLAESARKSDLS